MTAGVAALSRGASALGKIGKTILKSAPQAAMPLLFCGPAVYSAFHLTRDKNANEVKGLNVECGVSETLKQAKKWIGFSAIQGVMAAGMALAPLPLKPIFFAGSWIAAGKFNEFMEEIDPSEEKLVAQACKDKGIDYNPSLLGSLTSPQGAVV